MNKLAPNVHSIAIIHDATPAIEADTGPTEVAAISAVFDIAHSLSELFNNGGVPTECIALPPESTALLHTLATLSADVVVNFGESWRGVGRNEIGIAWILELIGIPYTGATARGLALCLEKPVTRAMLRAVGVPVARGAVMASAEQAIDFKAIGEHGPWIIKPSAQDASHGIDIASVVHDETALRARVAYLIDRGIGPALIEEYVDGRELNVSIMQWEGKPRVLPIGEIDYSRFPRGLPKILTYDGKWDEHCEEWKTSVPVPATNLSAALHEQLEKIALTTWHTMGLRDYGRIDFRVDARGPVVIDVNPNVDLTRGAGMHLAAERAGIPYEELIWRIVGAAAERANPEHRSSAHAVKENWRRP